MHRLTLAMCAAVAVGCSEPGSPPELTSPSPDVSGKAERAAPPNVTVEAADITLTDSPSDAVDADGKAARAQLRKLVCEAIAIGYSFESSAAREAVRAPSNCAGLNPTLKEILVSTKYAKADATRARLHLAMNVAAAQGARKFRVSLFRVFARDANDFKWRAEAVSGEGAESPLTDTAYLTQLVRDLGPRLEQTGKVWGEYLTPTAWDDLPAGVVRAADQIARRSEAAKAGRSLTLAPNPLTIERRAASLFDDVPPETRKSIRLTERRVVGYLMAFRLREGSSRDEGGYLLLDARGGLVAAEPAL
jgi:hypothetical protein